MLRTYIENKQKALMNQQVDFYTPSGIHVYFKDDLKNDQIKVLETILIERETIGPPRKKIISSPDL